MPPKRKPADDEAAAGNISALRDEIANLSKVLNSKLSLLEKVIEDVRDGQNGIVQSISFLNEKFEEMKTVTTKLEKDNGQLQQSNNRLQRQVEDLTRQVTDLDQYHRRVNLEFAGVPEEEGEDPDKLVLQIAKKIHPGISAADIDVVHRLGKANSDGSRGPRTIIARFTNRRSRNAIYDGKRKLQHVTTKDLGFRRSNGNGRIYVNENLVASTRELLKETNKARRSAGYKYLWTNNGRIYVKKDDRSIPSLISKKEDLSKLQ